MIPPLLTVAAAIVLGLLAAIGTVRAWRHGSYRRWPLALRWPFLGLVGSLATLGAVGVVDTYARKWGALAAVWLLLAPLARGLWSGVSGSRPPGSSSPAQR
jgi:hypothetical protein